MDIGQTGVTLNWELIAQVAGTPRGKFYRVKHPDTKSVQIARTISGRRYTFPEGLQFDRPVAAVITQFEQNSESFTIYDIPACHTLYEVLKTSILPFDRSFKIGLQIIDSLRVIHRGQKTHGMLSPEAVLLFSDDRIATIDYCLESLWESTQGQNELAYLDPTLPSLTSRDESSDIYALGVMLYQIATGLLPFEPSSIEEISSRPPKAPPPIGKRSSTWPFETFNIINSCLALDRALRPKSAAEIRNRIAKLSPTPIAMIDENEAKKQKRKSLTLSENKSSQFGPSVVGGSSASSNESAKASNISQTIQMAVLACVAAGVMYFAAGLLLN